MAATPPEEMAELETVDEEEALRCGGSARGRRPGSPATRRRAGSASTGPTSSSSAPTTREGSMFRVFPTTIFSLWGWHHVFPEYNNMLIRDLTCWPVACFDGKLVVEYAKAPLEAKAYTVDLASMDVMLFNLTGTLTCNKPCFSRDKIELFANGVDKDQAIILAARASRSRDEFYVEPLDAAILSLLDDPEQARANIEVLEHHVCFFVALKLMFLTTYIDSNGSKCSAFKSDPAKLAHQCGCSKAVKEKISMVMDSFVLDGYQAITVGHQVTGRLMLGVHWSSAFQR